MRPSDDGESKRQEEGNKRCPVGMKSSLFVAQGLDGIEPRSAARGI
jgi:hypothetical protein